MTPSERIEAALAQLEGDELEVVAEVADGLLRGRVLYGRLDLARDPRDMRHEAAEEILDARVYLAADLLRRGGGG